VAKSVVSAPNQLLRP